MLVTKSISLACSAPVAWRFLADGGQWPAWAVRNVLESRAISRDRWEIQTPRGPGQLHIRGVEDSGILDHDFIDATEGHWAVSARVVPISSGSLFLMTLEKPGHMPDGDFHRGLLDLDEELQQLAWLSRSLKED